VVLKGDSIPSFETMKKGRAQHNTHQYTLYPPPTLGGAGRGEKVQRSLRARLLSLSLSWN